MNKTKILIMMALSVGGSAAAEITLPAFVTDNMIVQQRSTLTVNGRAAANSKVVVAPGWADKTVTAVADSRGNFTVALPTPQAGGPYSILFTDRDGSRCIENVLSGEVWLCSGQSNMEFPVQGWTTVMGYDREVATAHHPDIRLLQVKKRTAFAPHDDVEVNGGGWQVCSSASVADFSALAYFFARELSQELKVPVGVIDATWGGTPAEAWTSAEALGAVEGFEQELADLRAANGDADALYALYRAKIDSWMSLAKAGTSDFDKSLLQTGSDWKEMPVPGYWEMSVLPGFDGVVWLQRALDIPATLSGTPLALNFRAIDDEDEVYFNGVLVGKGSGYDTPRSYSVDPQLVREGRNVITVRVSDFGGEGGIAPGTVEAVAAGTVFPLAGTWQYAVQTDFAQLPPKPASPYGSSYPSVLYNAMLSPLKAMPIKGVLWYQGCANVGRDRQYAPLFKALIGDWRKLWGEKTPFYFVQLAGYLQPKALQPDSDWAALRNAQAKALELDNTAMAVAADLGNPVDIHPKNKQEVAHRLALIALGRDYGRSCEYAAPRCVAATPRGNAVELQFDAPVAATSHAITGFIIAGDDRRFVTATPVRVDDRTLRLSAPSVSRPTAVRYGWSDYPLGNLCGATSLLPVAPFATDK